VSGKVRVLPYDFPGVPASVPLVDGRRDLSAMCCADVPLTEVPDGERLADDSTVGFICTLPKHPEDVHACHLLDDGMDEPLALIVWGGE